MISHADFKKIQIRDLLEEDIPKACCLMNSLFSVKKDNRFCAWQFFKNVFSVTIKAAFFSDKLIGLTGIQKRMLSNGAIAGQMSWLMVDQDWRGRGIFKEVITCALSSMPDLDILFVYANKAAAIACEKTLNMKNIRSIQNMSMSLSFPSLNHPLQVNCTEIDKKTFLNSIRNKPKNKVVFNNPSGYDVWRFACNPLYKYFKVGIDGTGYAIVKLFKDPNKNFSLGDIVDFDLDDYEKHNFHNLLIKTCAFLKHLGASSVNTWDFPGTSMHNILTDVGFSGTDARTFFLVKVLNDKHKTLYDSSNWFMKPSDSSNY